MSFTATRAAGLERLTAFIPSAGRHYANGRNADHGPDNRTNISMLSPYVRHRLVTEEEMVRLVLTEHSAVASEKYVQEILWRTYWKGWLELRPGIWTRYCADRDALAPTGGLAKAIASAEAGTTGIDGFDDWARELVEHGYLHNHARMWFASIWIFTLGLPWVAGADFFLRHLVDADPASNTLSWRWVAGLQTAGKTYLATADNIARYTDGRFSPTGLATRATEQVEPPVPAAKPLTPLAPYDPDTPALLLLTGEDLNPESLLPRKSTIRAVHAVAAVPGWPWGDAASAFLDTACADAAQRAAAYYSAPATNAAMLDVPALIDAAHAAGAKCIVTPFAPVGSVADALAAITPALAAAGLPLITVRREWDDTFWPRANKGFFPFKERIPPSLARLGIAY